MSRCSFFFFFFQVPSNPNPVKKKPSEEDRTNEKEEGKKKKVSWSKVAAEWIPHVCLITKMSLSYELWKLKTAKMCSVSIIHNSKIRELSDGNKKLKTELWFAKQNFFLELRWVPPFLRIELWKLRIEWWELMNQTAPKICNLHFFF